MVRLVRRSRNLRLTHYIHRNKGIVRGKMVALYKSTVVWHSMHLQLSMRLVQAIDYRYLLPY